MTSRRRYFFAGLFMAVLAFGQGCRQDNSTLLVRIDNRDSITVDEYRFFMQSKGKPANLSFEEKRSIVLGLVDQHLKALAAVDDHFHLDPDVMERLNDLEQRELSVFAHEKYLISHFVNDSTVAAFQSQYGREVTVQNIVVRYIDFAGSNAFRTKESARATADSIFKAARDTNFTRLAEAVSDFREPKSQKGFSRTEKFKYGSLPLDYETAVFASAPRTILAPIDLPGAFLIPYVQDFSIDSLARKLTKDETSKMIRGRLENLDRPIYLRHFIQFVQPLYDASRVVFHDAAIDTLTARFPAGAHGKAAAQNFSETNMDMTVVSYEGHTLTIRDLLTVKGNLFTVQRPERDIVVDALKAVVREDLLAAKARQDGLDKMQEFVGRLASKRTEILANKAGEARLKMSDSISTAELRRYYESHADQFRTTPMTRVQELYATSRADMDEALRLLNGGTEFTKVPDSLKALKGGQTTVTLKAAISLSPNQKHELNAPASKLAQDEVSGIIARKDGGFSIIKVIEKRDAVRQPFDSARRRVESQYRNELRTQMETRWLNGMKRKMDIVVYEGLIQ